MSSKHQHQKERGAQEGRDHADRQLARRNDRPSGRVREHHENAAEDQGSWQQQPVVTAENQSHQMGNDQTYKADDPAQGDRKSREQGNKNKEPVLYLLHVDAQLVSQIFANADDVEMS